MAQEEVVAKARYTLATGRTATFAQIKASDPWGEVVDQTGVEPVTS